MNYFEYQQYRVDINGDSPENEVSLDHLVRSDFGDGSIVIPRHAPFFTDSMELTFIDGTPMVLGEDYRFIDIDDRFTGLTAKPISIFIKLLRPNIKECNARYHTLGTLPLFNQMIISMTDISVNDTRPIWFDDLTGKPLLYPLKYHNHDINVDIYSADALIKVFKERFDEIYSGHDKSIHEDFFLQELTNLETYLKPIKEELTSLGFAHINNVWNGHGVKLSNMVDLNKLENVPTANYIETKELASDQLRMVVNPICKVIKESIVEHPGSLNVLDYAKYGTLIPYGNKTSLYTHDLEVLSFPYNNGAFYKSKDRKMGYGIVMAGNYDEDVLGLVVNFNIKDRSEYPLPNQWVNVHEVVRPKDGTVLNSIIRGSGPDYFMVGNYLTGKAYVGYFDMDDQPQYLTSKLVECKLTSNLTFNLELVKNSFMIKINKNKFLLVQPMGGDNTGLFKIWAINVDTGAVVSSTVGLVSEAMGTSSSNTKGVFIYKITYNDNLRPVCGVITKEDNGSYIKVGDPKVSWIQFSGGTIGSVPKIQGKLLIEETWVDEDGIELTIPAFIDLTVLHYGDNNIVIDDNKRDTTLAKINLDTYEVEHKQLCKLPKALVFNNPTIADLDEHTRMLVSRDENGAGICVTEINDVSFNPYPIDNDNFKDLSVFGMGHIYQEDERGIISHRYLKPLDYANGHDIKEIIGHYTEIQSLGGGVIFKAADPLGFFNHYCKPVESKMTTKKVNGSNIWLRDPSNRYIKLPHLQNKQIRISATDLRDESKFGETWFSAVSSANKIRSGSVRASVNGYVFDSQDAFSVIDYIGVHESFIESFLEDTLLEKVQWTVLFTNNQIIMPYNLLMIHGIKNGKLLHRLIQFTYDSDKPLPRITVNSANCRYLDKSVTINKLFDYSYIDKTLTVDEEEDVIWDTDLETIESGKYVLVVNDDDTTTGFFSSNFYVNGVEQKRPIQFFIEADGNGKITNLTPTNNYGDNSLYYVKTMGWLKVVPTDDLLLDGGSINSFSMNSDITSLVNGEVSNNVVVSPVDTVPEYNWTIYLKAPYVYSGNGFNQIVDYLSVDIRTLTESYKDTQLELYLLIDRDGLHFSIHNNGGTFIGYILTNTNGIVSFTIV